MSEEVHCASKHTKPQIPDEEWRCPKCGVSAEAEKPFVIEEPAEDSSENCSLLHDSDYAFCEGCGFGADGRKLARLYSKKASLVPCGHCKGTGMVKQ